ncbi:hypothetical protein [Bacillus toyonensis]|nr:hypothetical protein [Bacillus toyonensis]EOP30588.1 hypothetical protein IG5_00207 [Bacillus toyonensis]
MSNYQLTGKEVDTDFMVKDFLDSIGGAYSYQKSTKSIKKKEATSKIESS